VALKFDEAVGKITLSQLALEKLKNNELKAQIDMTKSVFEREVSALIV